MNSAVAVLTFVVAPAAGAGVALMRAMTRPSDGGASLAVAGSTASHAR